MTAKFAHAETKAAERKAHARTRLVTHRLVLAPQTLLMKRVYLKDGHTGTVRGYAGTASEQKYLVRLSNGERAEYAFEDIERIEG